ncbi:MAG: GFA family protein [Gammaproteobacteria bacterium]|nr:GFA family protein [Gammaproteobacteria bacterium]MYD75904.1 GFA family protein [Gammaproteobacteria bacterium]MYJ51095.1 GFA family protein [Gammaproteobacteria bacterium]
MGTEAIREGGCLCGGVTYRITGDIRGVVNCFCGQCRKTSGHHVAAVRCRKDQFELIADDTLSWYRSSSTARRGFCSRCGSSLFWEPFEGETISVMAGTLETPTGVRSILNIFVEDMSDYHDIPRLYPES